MRIKKRLKRLKERQNQYDEMMKRRVVRNPDGYQRPGSLKK